MIGYIALCSRQGIVKRVIRSVPLGMMNVGQDIRSFFFDGEKLDELLQQDLEYGASIRLQMKIEENPFVYITAKSIEKWLLFCVYDIEEPSQLSQLMEMSLVAVLNIPELFNCEEYGSGYYEIQKQNSRLINYQRTLAKTNAWLQKLLDEAREAKSMIEVLERDALTGLYTEKVFYDKADLILREHPDLEFDIMAVDIEQFKIVNDVFGTETGDRLLIDLSASFPSVQTDELTLMTRARADTFFILLPRGKAVFDTVDKNLRYFQENYPLPMRLQIKVGIYQIQERDLAVARMCDRALLAASSIKGNYSRRIAPYNHQMHEKLILEQKIINTMVEALQREEFAVYLQPKVEVETERVIGAEALVRWNHPEFGVVSPADFIPIFEKNGFIYTMDLFVWEKACGMLREWKRKGISGVPISVNMSRTDFYYEDIPETLLRLIQTYDLEPEDLHLEITESAYARDSAQMLKVIKRLKKAGFVIEMDDFGSGYSSLNTLSELPIDVLKLDMIFLRQTENETRGQTVLKLVIKLAKELELQVIAEGVETKEQALGLKSMGCGYAQGYLYGRPVPEQEFRACLTQ